MCQPSDPGWRVARRAGQGPQGGRSYHSVALLAASMWRELPRRESVGPPQGRGQGRAAHRSV
ncbi:unnamed protein product [Prunus armeniaca]